MTPKRVYLSPPHMTGREMDYVTEAFASNWIAPLGPNVDAFEAEFAAAVGSPHALAVSSGTAALHLALAAGGVTAGDSVVVSTLTFAASVNPIIYLGASPILVDCDATWQVDPFLLADTLDAHCRRGKRPRAVVAVHLYGGTVDLAPVIEACTRWGVLLIEDAAEALGSLYQDRMAGSICDVGVYSFNGNKIITTSGGGMLVSRDGRLVEHARKLATQAREPAVHYEHHEVGYNYRLSNVLAGIGRAQLQVLGDRVEARRRIFRRYRELLGGIPGISFMPEPRYCRHNRWLTCIGIDPAECGVDRERLRLALEAQNIESRPVWKPMHLQRVFSGCEVVGGNVSSSLFEHGLCLPSGSSLSDEDIGRVAATILEHVR